MELESNNSKAKRTVSTEEKDFTELEEFYVSDEILIDTIKRAVLEVLDNNGREIDSIKIVNDKMLVSLK